MKTASEIAAIKKLASQVKEGVILEIGALGGVSTFAMAKVSKVPIYAVDIWDLTFPGDIRPEKWRNPSHYSYFQKKLLLYKNIIPIKALSQELCKIWTFPIGLLFIDGGSAAEREADYYNFSKHVLPEGYLVFHDYTNLKMAKCIDIIKQSPNWYDWRKEGESLIFAKRRPSISEVSNDL